MTDHVKSTASADTEVLRAEAEAQAHALAAEVAAARKQQTAAGKEPFDLVRLAQLFDVEGPFGEHGDAAVRAAEYERRYYLRYPKLMTLQAFADELEKAAPYR